MRLTSFFHLACVWHDMRSTLFISLCSLEDPLKKTSYAESFKITPPLCSHLMTCLETGLKQAGVAWDHIGQLSLACTPSSLTAQRGITAFFQGFSQARSLALGSCSIFEVLYRCLPEPKPETAWLILGPSEAALAQKVDARGTPIGEAIPYTPQVIQSSTCPCFTDDISLATVATYIAYPEHNPSKTLEDSNITLK